MKLPFDIFFCGPAQASLYVTESGCFNKQDAFVIWVHMKGLQGKFKNFYISDLWKCINT